MIANTAPQIDTNRRFYPPFRFFEMKRILVRKQSNILISIQGKINKVQTNYFKSKILINLTGGNFGSTWLEEGIKPKPVGQPVF